MSLDPDLKAEISARTGDDQGLLNSGSRSPTQDSLEFLRVNRAL